ncbi:hypothetical protein [Clostridium sp. CF012]|uniref:hypothetical protein n=1 Tax=Clostridium sp. CF012 TaxID=2843319 RepID=UPI001C0C9CBF|nr:hypothetical protein [Clostridium sp. CF012]MBU3145526.1 hypothetical protein [Clostridium sp. CF012]
MIIFFSVVVVVLSTSLFLCDNILKLFEKRLSETTYKVTAKFRYFLSCLIIIMLGIAVGKVIIGKLI